MGPALARRLARVPVGARPADDDAEAWRRLLDAAPATPLRAMPGRRTEAVHLALGDGSSDAVLKRFTGDEPVDWWYERLRLGRLALARPRTPAAREFDALCTLASLGLAVPAALLSLEDGPVPRWFPPRPGRGGVSAVLLERVDGGRPLHAELVRADDAARRRLLAALGALVARFHAAGWYHRDLNLGHLLVDARGDLVLIDLGRARREERPRRRWFVKDLAALFGSAPATVTRAERLRFLRDWLAAVRGASGPRERRAWARAVVAKAAALAAHRPRHDGRPAVGELAPGATP